MIFSRLQCILLNFMRLFDYFCSVSYNREIISGQFIVQTDGK